MEGRNFRFLQSKFASKDLQDEVAQIIESTKLLDCLPRSSEIEITIENQIPTGASLAEAHHTWQQGYIVKVQTPGSLPRQLEQAICPRNLIRVSVECIERKHPGMGSYYGFTGYYLSMLISLDSKKIWDTRGEHAT